MRYLAAGPEDGSPLILLHGLGDTSRSWTLVLPDLARRHRVYMPDQRGHGDSEAPACCYSLAVLAYDVVAFMEAMKVDKAAVAGHSLGSFVAQYLASAYPQRVSQLVLLGSSDTTVGVESIDWLWGKARAFESRISPEFVDEWQSNPTPVPPDFLAKVKAETAAVPPHVWKAVARTLSTEDQRRFLSEIKAPTLVLWGEMDAMFPRANQERLHKAVPGAAFRAYPKVGHNLHWEIPRQVAGDLEAFLQ
jgi:pimeloyl-ACP methyl ester carboxylesterase